MDNKSFEQLGLLKQDTNGYVIQKKYLDTVFNFVNEPKGFTEEDLLKWLEEKKKLGILRNILVLNHERNRLRHLDSG